MSISSNLDEDKIDIDMSDVDLNDDQDHKNSLFAKQLCNGNKETKDYDQDTVYSIPVVQGAPLQYIYIYIYIYSYSNNIDMSLLNIAFFLFRFL